MKTTTTFKSQQTKKPWKIIHSKSCKTVIYHLPYGMYDMQPTVGQKYETPFSIRLNNHKEDIKDP